MLLTNSKLIQKMLLKFQEHQLRELLKGNLRTRMAEVVERAQQRRVPLFALLGERECGLWRPPALNRVRQWHVDPPLRACRALCRVIELHTITDDIVKTSGLCTHTPLCSNRCMNNFSGCGRRICAVSVCLFVMLFWCVCFPTAGACRESTSSST